MKQKFGHAESFRGAAAVGVAVPPSPGLRGKVTRGRGSCCPLGSFSADSSAGTWCARGRLSCGTGPPASSRLRWVLLGWAGRGLAWQPGMTPPVPALSLCTARRPAPCDHAPALLLRPRQAEVRHHAAGATARGQHRRHHALRQPDPGKAPAATPAHGCSCTHPGPCTRPQATRPGARRGVRNAWRRWMLLGGVPVLGGVCVLRAVLVSVAALRACRALRGHVGSCKGTWGPAPCCPSSTCRGIRDPAPCYHVLTSAHLLCF